MFSDAKEAGNCYWQWKNWRGLHPVVSRSLPVDFSSHRLISLLPPPAIFHFPKLRASVCNDTRLTSESCPRQKSEWRSQVCCSQMASGHATHKYYRKYLADVGSHWWRGRQAHSCTNGPIHWTLAVPKWRSELAYSFDVFIKQRRLWLGPPSHRVGYKKATSLPFLPLWVFLCIICVESLQWHNDPSYSHFHVLTSWTFTALLCFEKAL